MQQCRLSARRYRSKARPPAGTDGARRSYHVSVATVGADQTIHAQQVRLDLLEQLGHRDALGQGRGLSSASTQK